MQRPCAARAALSYLVLMGAALGALGAMSPQQQAAHHRHFEAVEFDSSLGLVYPAPVVFPATAEHTASVIFLHGLVRGSPSPVCQTLTLYYLGGTYADSTALTFQAMVCCRATLQTAGLAMGRSGRSRCRTPSSSSPLPPWCAARR